MDFNVAPQLLGPCECLITLLTPVGCLFIVGWFFHVGYLYFVCYLFFVILVGYLSDMDFKVSLKSDIINEFISTLMQLNCPYNADIKKFCLTF